eukprot:g4000.t1
MATKVGRTKAALEAQNMLKRMLTSTAPSAKKTKNSDDSKMNFWKKLGSPKYVVAPMVAQSELPYRLLTRKYGAKLCFTPMIHSRLFVEQKHYREEAMQDLIPGTADRPLFVQFCGNDEKILYEAAKRVEDKCDAIDLNLGCPQGIARRGHYGAFLLTKLDLLERIVRHLSSNLSIPVTCKIRLLPTREESLKLAKTLVDAGCSLLTVHGRTKEEKKQFIGPCDWETIRAIKRAVDVPVIANGGIATFADVEKCLEETECDGVMSSEAVLENPALFDETGAFAKSSTLERQMKLTVEYLELAKTYPAPSLKVVKKHVICLAFSMFMAHRSMIEVLFRCGSIDEVRDVLKKLESMIGDLSDPVINANIACPSDAPGVWYTRHQTKAKAKKVERTEEEKEHRRLAKKKRKKELKKEKRKQRKTDSNAKRMRKSKQEEKKARPVEEGEGDSSAGGTSGSVGSKGSCSLARLREKVPIGEGDDKKKNSSSFPRSGKESDAMPASSSSLAVTIADFDSAKMTPPPQSEYRISIRCGDSVRVFYEVQKGGWIWAVNERNGEQGYVPAAFVRKMKGENRTVDKEHRFVDIVVLKPDIERMRKREVKKICGDILCDVVDRSLVKVSKKEQFHELLGVARTMVDRGRASRKSPATKPFVRRYGEIVSQAATLLRLCDEVEEVQRVGNIVDAHCDLALRSMSGRGKEKIRSPLPRVFASLPTRALLSPSSNALFEASRRSNRLSRSRNCRDRITTVEKKKLIDLHRSRRRKEMGAWKSLLACEEEAAVERRLRRMERISSRAESIWKSRQQHARTSERHPVPPRHRIQPRADDAFQTSTSSYEKGTLRLSEDLLLARQWRKSFVGDRISHKPSSKNENGTCAIAGLDRIRATVLSKQTSELPLREIGNEIDVEKSVNLSRKAAEKGVLVPTALRIRRTKTSSRSKSAVKKGLGRSQPEAVTTERKVEDDPTAAEVASAHAVKGMVQDEDASLASFMAEMEDLGAV